MWLQSLSPPRRMPAVHGKDHARSISRPIRRQERHEVADLARMRRPAERQAFLKILVAVLVAELVLGAGLQQRDVTVGADRAGIDADDADVVGQTLAPSARVNAISAALPALPQI